MTGPDPETPRIDDPLHRLRQRSAAAAGPAAEAGAEGRVGPSQPVAATEPVLTPEPVGAPNSAPAVERTDPEAVAAVDHRTPTVRASGSTTLVAAAVAFVVVLATLATLAIAHLSHARSEQHLAPVAMAMSATERPAILKAAVNEVTDVSTYSWKTLAADEQRAEAGLAPSFKAGYEAKFAQQVKPLAVKYHASAQASVDTRYGVGLVSQPSPDAATVLIFLDQVSRNDQLKHPRLDRTRVLATLTRINGDWLISGIETV